MTSTAKFVQAFPYQDDVLALPVKDIDEASAWYSKHFSMTEVQRIDSPTPTVILERDGTQIGFAINGGDATQDGAAVLVNEIETIREQFEGEGLNIGDWRIDDRDGKKFKVFFVVAPDGLCYYFHEPLADDIS
ncbi:VOC family protein [Stieleria sp. JC731]|uniref:VOC family protein n=1 Tax=Pirellulaceae TaxID=2691357 RepID=UPI001E53E446|nr:VOC family protein [Stieleria sp. JC731]MCC9602611.1 VOC family protein [Stieleria sp. JC731]